MKNKVLELRKSKGLTQEQLADIIGVSRQTINAIEKEKFDREGFLGLFGVWKDKSEKEIEIFREVLRERDLFERREVKI